MVSNNYHVLFWEDQMVRPVPYIFCRYEIKMNEEQIGLVEQRKMLHKYQGEHFPHGRPRRGSFPRFALIMIPKEFNSDGETCLTWLAGIRTESRVQTSYDRDEMRINEEMVKNPHIRRASFLSLPKRGVMAIEDRSNDRNIPARQAIAAFRSVVQNCEEDSGSFEVSHGKSSDVERWIKEWGLEEYSYTIGPLNPVTGGDLAERRSDAMKRENAIRGDGTMHPPEGETMRPDGGIIEETLELRESGYGQIGFRGRTPDGHVVHVRKPKFHSSSRKNLMEREKQQFVRVMLDPGEDLRDLSHRIATALRDFYGG